MTGRDSAAERRAQDTPSSAGVCQSCGKYADKRYGGEGRYLVECAECWLGLAPGTGASQVAPGRATTAEGEPT